MILPERVLGRSGVNHDLLRPRDRADLLRDVLLQLADQRIGRVVAAAQDDEGEDRLAADFVRLPDDCRLRDRWVRDQRALDFGRAQAMPSDIHDVVNAAEQPVVPLFVALAAITGEVLAREAAPVGLLVALGIAVDTAQHRRPWLLSTR